MRAARPIREALHDSGIEFDEIEYRVVPDEQSVIEQVLIELAEKTKVDLILTTGGTGLAPRDVTPQATLRRIEYEVPGMAEVMRAESVRVTPAGMLSTGRGWGARRDADREPAWQPKAVRETLPVIAPALPHAITTLKGDVGEHSRPRQAQDERLRERRSLTSSG